MAGLHERRKRAVLLGRDEAGGEGTVLLPSRCWGEGKEEVFVFKNVLLGEEAKGVFSEEKVVGLGILVGQGQDKAGCPYFKTKKGR